MGLLLLRRKESGRAVAYLQKSLEASPNHTAALLALGEAQSLEHDYANAIASLEKFLREQPRSPQASATQKYIGAMRKLLQQETTAEVETPAASSESSPSGADTTKTQVGSAGDGGCPTRFRHSGFSAYPTPRVVAPALPCLGLPAGPLVVP